MNDVTQFVANFGHFLVDRLHSLPGIRNSLVVHFLHCFDLLLGQVPQHAVQFVSTGKNFSVKILQFIQDGIVHLHSGFDVLSGHALYPALLHFVTIFPIFKQVILD